MPTVIPSHIDEVVQIAKRGVTLSTPITAYVIGLFAPDDENALPNLLKIAAAGGTEQSFIIDATADVGAKVQSALAAIRADMQDCKAP